MVIGDWELEAKYYGKQPTKGVATHMHVHTSQMSGIIIFLQYLRSSYQVLPTKWISLIIFL